MVTWDTDGAIDLGLPIDCDPGPVRGLSVPDQLDSVASCCAANFVAGGSARGLLQSQLGGYRIIAVDCR